ncbi:MAG: hypothetical protein J6D29_00785 [Solobacterium sp.]|nr:hypothetical protein [Solobacterium sp.]
MSDLTNQVLEALQANPALLNAVVEECAEGPKRAMPGEDDALTAMLKGVLGSAANAESLEEVTKGLGSNAIMQLLTGAQGAIDPTELLQFTGGFLNNGNANNNAGLRALFDGKLDFKEILMLVMLLKLFKNRKQQQSQAYTSSQNLFNSLLGQTQQQPTSLFGSLFGAQPQTQSGVLSLGGNNNAYLESFLSGNTGNNLQAQQLYSLLNGASQNAFNSNGQINVNQLFGLASQLLGGR